VYYSRMNCVFIIAYDYCQQLAGVFTRHGRVLCLRAFWALDGRKVCNDWPFGTYR